MNKTLYIVKDFADYDSYHFGEIIYDDYIQAYKRLLCGDNNYHLQTYQYDEELNAYTCINTETLKDIIEKNTIHNEIKEGV